MEALPLAMEDLVEDIVIKMAQAQAPIPIGVREIALLVEVQTRCGPILWTVETIGHSIKVGV